MIHTQMTDKIYVQIPSYRDSELFKTIKDLLNKAGNKNNLRVCVLWQRSENEKLPRYVKKLSNVEIVEIDYKMSKGCNWARNYLQRQWNDEKYTLLIDSHLRFIDGWDEKIIGQYEKLKDQGNSKPIITGYLPRYDPVSDPRGREKMLFKIFPNEKERVNGLLLKLASFPVPLWTWLKEPIPANFVSLHFLFTEGWFNHEIVFDPETYYAGDEVTASLRAFTFGYHLFQPHFVVGWHVYDLKTRIPHWNDHSSWHLSEQRSNQIIRSLFDGTYRGDHGIGKVRTIKEYEKLIFAKLIRN